MQGKGEKVEEERNFFDVKSLFIGDGFDCRLGFWFVEPSLRHLKATLDVADRGKVLVEFVTIGGIEIAVERFCGFAEGVEDAGLFAESLAFLFASRDVALDEEGLEEAGGIVDGGNADAGPGPAHVGSCAEPGIDGGEAGGAPDVFGGDLIK